MALQFQSLLTVVRKAAEKKFYPDCVEYIENNLKVDHRQLAIANLIYFLPPQIVMLDTVEERRKAIESIPDICDPPHLKSAIKSSVRRLWANRTER